MEGYVRRRVLSSGAIRYQARLGTGRNPGNGKRQQVTRTFERERDAWRWVRDQSKALEQDRFVERHDTTLGEYLTNEWLPMILPTLKPSTAASYRWSIVTHVVPLVGALPLQRLKPPDLAQFSSALVATPKRNRAKGTLSPKTVRNVFGILEKALSDAVDLNYLAANPAAAKSAKPRVRVARTGAKIKAWDEGQLGSFLDATTQSPYWSAWFLAAYTGMRRGELIGLRWSDVDLGRARLHVRQSVVLAGGEAVDQEDGKTLNSARSIDLDPDTIDILLNLQKAQSDLLAEVGIDSSEYVFCRPDGSHLEPDSFSQAFDRAVARQRAIVPKLSLQGLRHTHATILLKAGVPVKVVSERLGHASVAFTMMQYQHVLPGMQADAALTFAQAIDRRPAPRH